jgi:hypothetical protein
MPEDFSPAQESDAVEMFPYRERPQYILSSPGFSRFLTLSLLEKILKSEDVISAAKELRKMIWSLNPDSMISEANPMCFGNLKCSGFSFHTGAGEDQVFNTMFVVSFEGKMLLGTYGCSMSDEEGKTLLRKCVAESEYMQLRNVRRLRK